MIKINKIFITIIVALALTLPLTACGSSPSGTAAATVTQAAQTKEDGSQKTFTKDQLKEFNGQNGKAAYVAVNGTVYDVSNVKQWVNGTHHGVEAGKDLTEAIKSSPHGLSVLEKLPVVGKLVN